MAQVWQSKYWPKFTYDHERVEPYLATSSQKVGEITGLIDGLPDTDREEFHLSQIAQEVISSFGIEGVPLDETEIQASIVASLKHRDRQAITRRSDAVAELMAAARSTMGPLDPNTLFDWHQLLFFGIELQDLGRWRRFDLEIVRSAVAGSNDVLYKAPPPERLEHEMNVFLSWLAQDQGTPVPIKAALAHLWFESIHPFSDGNGRIGRALIEFVFAQQGALAFSFSRQVERDKKAYYHALQAGRKEGRGGIDATEFVIWFLQTLESASVSAREEAQFVLRRNRFFLRFTPQLNERQERVLRKLFEQGPARVNLGISAKAFRKISGASTATATRDLLSMEALGVLKRSEAGGRSTVYWLNY
ncbi:MAG: Fic family protein [Pseudomonadota bacterium]